MSNIKLSAKQKEVIRAMREGWQLEEKRNFDGSKILSYWLGKRNERDEPKVSSPIRQALLVKGIIDRNDILTELGKTIQLNDSKNGATGKMMKAGIIK